MPKSAAHQFLVKVAGIDGYFATKSGGAVTAPSAKVYDGGARNPDVVGGRRETGDVTVGRPWDARRDGPLARNLRGRVGSWRTTVSVTPTDVDMIPVDQPTVYSDALLVGCTDPDVDANSGDPSRLELTFATGSVS